MSPEISIIDQCKVYISAFECAALGAIGQTIIDLTPYAGQFIRIWLDDDGTYSLNPASDHFWQMAELQVPEIGYIEVPGEEIDPVTGEPVLVPQAQPLDLTAVNVELWNLPV